MMNHPFLGALTLVGLSVGSSLFARAVEPGKNPEATSKAIHSANTPADRSHESWWAAVHAQYNERAKQAAATGDVGIIFLGDSITQQWGGPGKEVWQEFYAKRGAMNLGIGGDRTQTILWRLDHGNVEGLAKPAKGHAPKLVVLMIGTNNAQDNTAQEIADGIRADVAKVREKLPTTNVLLLAIFPRERSPNAIRENVRRASELAKDIADGVQVHFMDLSSTFYEKDGTISKVIMPDYIHLSPEGYRRWAMAIEPKVKELLGEALETKPTRNPAPIPATNEKSPAK